MLFSKNRDRKLKRWHVVFLLVMIGLAIVYKLFSMYWPKAIVNIGGESLTVLLANNYRHRFEGWSNKNSMGKYGGMLFVFPERSQHAMVMRDMRFPLDLVWLDGFTIVDIAAKAAPEPGRAEKDLTLYLARSPSTMVLELPSGFAEKHGLKVGDSIKVASD